MEIPIPRKQTVIKDKLKEFMLERNVSPQVLAEKLGWSIDDIYGIRSAQRKVSDLKLFRIFTKGYGMNRQQALKTIRDWRTSEFIATYM